MSKSRIITTIAAMMALSATLSAQQEKTDWLKQLSSRITINANAQAGYTYTHFEGTSSNTYELKRTLLWARARITDRWSFFFMHDFNSQVQEYYTDFRVTKGPQLTIRFGQFKNQLSHENILSPAMVESVDITSQAVAYLAGGGSDPMFGIQYGRDLGLEIRGELFGSKLHYNLQLMNGRGINSRDLDNKKDIIVKLDYRPIAGLRLIASAQKGYGTSAVASSVYIPEVNAIAQGETYRRDRWTVGAEYKTGTNDYWKNRCLSVRGEVLGGRDGKTHSWGGYVTTSVPLYRGLDVIASYDYFNYAKGFDRDRTELIGGLQYWFYRQCRIMAQYTWASTWTRGYNTQWVDAPCSRIQVQTQVVF